MYLLLSVTHQSCSKCQFKVFVFLTSMFTCVSIGCSIWPSFRLLFEMLECIIFFIECTQKSESKIVFILKWTNLQRYICHCSVTPANFPKKNILCMTFIWKVAVKANPLNMKMISRKQCRLIIPLVYGHLTVNLKVHLQFQWLVLCITSTWKVQWSLKATIST